MRTPAARRYAFALVFALLAGAFVALYNPVDHLKADFRADAGGLKFSLEVAARDVDKHF